MFICADLWKLWPFFTLVSYYLYLGGKDSGGVSAGYCPAYHGEVPRELHHQLTEDAGLDIDSLPTSSSSTVRGSNLTCF